MDNYYQKCPPMMSDGRLFTDFRTATRREETNKYINNIVRDDEYRLFLEQNAEVIMDNIWKYNKKTKNCWQNECIHNYPTRAFPPWFVDERKAYNQLTLPDNKRDKLYECQSSTDYRATHTKNTKY
jgi:hypothetical protein